jgi:hypothetical protein
MGMGCHAALAAHACVRANFMERTQQVFNLEGNGDPALSDCADFGTLASGLSEGIRHDRLSSHPSRLEDDFKAGSSSVNRTPKTVRYRSLVER